MVMKVMVVLISMGIASVGVIKKKWDGYWTPIAVGLLVVGLTLTITTGGLAVSALKAEVETKIEETMDSFFDIQNFGK